MLIGVVKSSSIVAIALTDTEVIKTARLGRVGVLGVIVTYRLDYGLVLALSQIALTCLRTYYSRRVTPAPSQKVLAQIAFLAPQG